MTTPITSADLSPHDVPGAFAGFEVAACAAGARDGVLIGSMPVFPR